MKRISYLFLAAFSFFFLCGCELRFTSFTKIKEDGSGFRITTYFTDGISEKEELATRYVLPEGGSWKSEQVKRGQYDVTTDTYEVKRQFNDLNKLAPDYVRKGALPQNVSGNKFSLKIGKSLFFSTYEYEEAFKDCTDEKKIRNFWERQYEYTIGLVSKDIAAAFPKSVEKEKVVEALNKRYRSYFDYFLKEFLKNPVFFKDNAEYEEKNREFEKLNSEENFSSFIADLALSDNKKADRQAVVARAKEAYNKISEEIQLHTEMLSEKNANDNLGVYGILVFTSYPFRISVSMPGKVISANTKDIKFNVASWSFSNTDFFLKEYKLKVKSRKLNYLNVGILVFAILALLVGMSFKGHIRRKNG